MSARMDGYSRRCRSAAVGAFLVLAGCVSSYPLGMSEEEWVRLTPEQQLAARMQQSEINRVNAERLAQAQAAERERQAILQAEERERLEAVYDGARYGDILECVVQGGVADFHPGWRSYTPAPFSIARGERKQVPLNDGGRQQGRFWASYSQDGRELSICYRDPQARRGERCASVNGMFRDFSAGVRREITAPDVFQSASLMCAYRPGPGMPRIVQQVEIKRVIEHHHHHTRVAPPVVVREHVIVKEEDGRRRHSRDGDRQDQRRREWTSRTPGVPTTPRQSAANPSTPESPVVVQPAPQPAIVPPTSQENRPSAHKPHPTMPPKSRAEEHAAPNSAVHRQAPDVSSRKPGRDEAKADNHSKGHGKGRSKRDEDEHEGDQGKGKKR